MPNFVKIGEVVAELSPFFDFYDGGCPPSWICFQRLWTTHEAYLVVVIDVQNLVGIHAEV